MGKFLTKLEYDRKVEIKSRFIPFFKKTIIQLVLTEPLVYQDSVGGKYEVPKGFPSDGASIPSFTWMIVGHPFGSYLEAAVVHDYLCFEDKVVSKKRDWVFLDAMKTQGVEGWKRNVMFRAVRMFGGIHKLLTNNKEKR